MLSSSIFSLSPSPRLACHEAADSDSGDPDRSISDSSSAGPDGNEKLLSASSSEASDSSDTGSTGDMGSIEISSFSTSHGMGDSSLWNGFHAPEASPDDVSGKAGLSKRRSSMPESGSSSFVSPGSPSPRPVSRDSASSSSVERPISSSGPSSSVREKSSVSSLSSDECSTPISRTLSSLPASSGSRLNSRKVSGASSAAGTASGISSAAMSAAYPASALSASISPSLFSSEARPTLSTARPGIDTSLKSERK